jgi:2-polyprenyl-3-methyl-5-hydroxy-6-metoxy-1,4-benzoquinol methylase
MTVSSQKYDTKSQAYFTRARHDILPLLPVYSERVLELGCGNGATLFWLKELQRAKFTHGLELFEPMANEAKLWVDEVTVGNAEQLLPTYVAAQYDLILCLDVLEHLVDPWQVVDECARLLRPGGTIIASIPNMRTAVVLWKLLVKGEFDYANEGIMDRTHLRWFTRKSAVALLQRPGLHLAACVPTPLAPGSKSDWFNRLSLGVFRDFVSIQYLVSATKKQ